MVFFFGFSCGERGRASPIENASFEKGGRREKRLCSEKIKKGGVVLLNKK